MTSSSSTAERNPERRGAQPPRSLRARLVTGPGARGLAFTLDFAAALVRTIRGNPEHPEERRVPKS